MILEMRVFIKNKSLLFVTFLNDPADGCRQYSRRKSKKRETVFFLFVLLFVFLINDIYELRVAPYKLLAVAWKKGESRLYN